MPQTAMKVRILGNSIRYRLRQKEVLQFQELGEVREISSFGAGNSDKLSFVLKKSSRTGFKITLWSCTVTIEVPKSVCDEWTNTDLVGFEEDIDTGKGETIKILVEKDFKCLDGSDAENEDAYPNPGVEC
jgi:hypothetical protein